MAKPGVANVRHTPTADTASSTDLENDDSSAASSDDEPFSEIGELSDTEVIAYIATLIQVMRSWCKTVLCSLLAEWLLS